MYLTHNNFIRNNKHKIYCFNRKTSIEYVIEDSKKKVGVGKYDTYNFDEKRVKPPRGVSLN
jgi:hypothetical protein